MIIDEITKLMNNRNIRPEQIDLILEDTETSLKIKIKVFERMNRKELS